MGAFTYELSPPPGINSDDTTFSAKGRWADGSNVRFRGGKPQTIGPISTTGRTVFPSSTYPRAMHRWVTSAGSERRAYGGNDWLQINTTVITPSPTPDTYNGMWVFQNWGDYLLANATQERLYVWDNVLTNIATEITQAPPRINSILVTPQRQVLALGCNEEASGSYNQRCIRGCDLEDYTDWVTTPTNNAFEHILESDAGKIITGRMVGDYVAIWTTTGLWVGLSSAIPARPTGSTRLL